MKAKTIFIIVLTALVTIVLMKNADEVNFWIFGNYTIPKLAILGTMFLIGVVIGWMLGRGRKKKESPAETIPLQEFEELDEIDDEDRDYLK